LEGSAVSLITKPIDENTPRDKRILVWIPDRRYQPGCWTAARWYGDKYATNPKPYWDAECFIRTREKRLNQPSHWMPLPEPPEKNNDQ
jgi:hypothetical protein